MDLQSRKLNAIEYLIRLNDEEILKKIESTIFESINKADSKNEFKPFSRKQLIDRANRSNRDYINGNFKSQEQLEKESKNW